MKVYVLYTMYDVIHHWFCGTFSSYEAAERTMKALVHKGEHGDEDDFVIEEFDERDIPKVGYPVVGIAKA